MSKSEYREPNYPIVQFLIKHGVWLSIVIGVAAGAATIILATTLGLSLLGTAISIAGAIVATFLLISYVEVLRIIADTLLPK